MRLFFSIILLFILPQIVDAQFVTEEKKKRSLTSSIKAGLSIGYGQGISPKKDYTPIEILPYLNKLSRSWDINVFTAYKLNQKHAIGVGLTNSYSSGRLDDVSIVDPETNQTIDDGYISNRINIIILGPSYCFDYDLKLLNLRIGASINFGWLRYSNNEWVVNRNYRITQDSYGINSSLSLQMPISKKFSYGVRMGYIYGRLSEKQDNSSYVSFQLPNDLSRFNVSFTVTLDL